MPMQIASPEIRQVPVPGGRMEDNYGEKVRSG